METLTALLPLLLIVAVFWLLILRPAQKRQQAQRQLVNAVRPGQRVMTTAGMLATVVDVTDDEVGLQIAPGVVVRYVKAAIGQILPDADADADGDAQTDADSAADGDADAVTAEGSGPADDTPAARPGS